MIKVGVGIGPAMPPIEEPQPAQSPVPIKPEDKKKK